MKNRETLYNIYDYLTELKLKLRYAHTKAKKNVLKSKIVNRNMQSNANKANFQVGEFAYAKVGNKRNLETPF